MAEEVTAETQPTTFPQPQTKSQVLKYVLFAALGLLLLAGAAYAGYWYGTQQVKQVETLPTVSQPAPTSSSVADTVVEWETYRDEERRFEFMYPTYAEMWFMKDMTATVRIKSPIKRLEFEELSDGNVISVGIRRLKGSQTMEEYVNSEIEKVVVNPDFGLAKKKEPIAVGGSNGYTFISTSDKFGSSQKIYLVNPFSKSEFAEIGCDYPSASQQGCIQLATQILSTFKFLD